MPVLGRRHTGAQSNLYCRTGRPSLQSYSSVESCGTPGTEWTRGSPAPGATWDRSPRPRSQILSPAGASATTADVRTSARLTRGNKRIPTTDKHAGTISLLVSRATSVFSRLPLAVASSPPIDWTTADRHELLGPLPGTSHFTLTNVKPAVHRKHGKKSRVTSRSSAPSGEYKVFTTATNKKQLGHSSSAPSEYHSGVSGGACGDDLEAGLIGVTGELSHVKPLPDSDDRDSAPVVTSHQTEPAMAGCMMEVAMPPDQPRVVQYRTTHSMSAESGFQDDEVHEVFTTSSTKDCTPDIDDPLRVLEDFVESQCEDGDLDNGITNLNTTDLHEAPGVALVGACLTESTDDSTGEASEEQNEASSTCPPEGSSTRNRSLWARRISPALTRLNFDQCQDPEVCVGFLKTPSTKTYSALSKKLKTSPPEWMQGK